MKRGSGWLAGAERRPSPNCDDRPANTTVDLLVIHSISLPPGEFGGPWIDALFQNRLDHSAHPYFSGLKDLKVSSHLLIRRDGSLVQYVPLHQRAWHAGKSSFEGRDGCNDFSIGVELEGCDSAEFVDLQYAALGRVTRTVMDRFPAITTGRIVGHRDISPGRKTDPGPLFDWDRFLAAIDGARIRARRRRPRG